MHEIAWNTVRPCVRLPACPHGSQAQKQQHACTDDLIVWTEQHSMCVACPFRSLSIRPHALMPPRPLLTQMPPRRHEQRSVGSVGSIPAPQLTRLITSCETAGALFAVVQAHGHVFNFIHASAALARLAKLPLGTNTQAGVAQLLGVAWEQLPQMGAQALANSLWAVSKLGVDDGLFVAALLRSARPQLPSFNAQALVNTTWALATLRHTDADFMGALLEVAKPKLSSFEAQSPATMAWALAMLGHNDAAFMRALLVVAKSRLSYFNEQNLANTAWALATLGHNDAVFMGSLLSVAKPKLSSFKPQDLANMAWALATLGRNDADLMCALLAAAKPKLSSFKPRDLANMAWALATLGHTNADFIGSLLSVANPKLCSFKPQHLANMAWALAALDERNAAFAGALIHVASARDFSSKEPRQLFQFILWLDTWQAGTDVPPQLLAGCKQAWLEEVGNTSVSRTQLQVLDAIRQLPGCSGASSEHLTDDGLFSIDIALQLPGTKKLAVEVDGPSHYLSNAPTVPNGATRLRTRLLEARGWRVVSVPVTEWVRQVAKGEQAARDYLMTSLAWVAGTQRRARSRCSRPRMTCILAQCSLHHCSSSSSVVGVKAAAVAAVTATVRSASSWHCAAWQSRQQRLHSLPHR
jgi:hypothetical protein